MEKDEDLEDIKKGFGLKNAEITVDNSDETIKKIVKTVLVNELKRATWKKSKILTKRKGRGTTTVVRLSPKLKGNNNWTTKDMYKSKVTGKARTVTHNVPKCQVCGGGTIKVIRKHPRVGNVAALRMRLSRCNGGTTTTIRKNDNKKG